MLEQGVSGSSEVVSQECERGKNSQLLHSRGHQSHKNPSLLPSPLATQQDAVLQPVTDQASELLVTPLSPPPLNRAPVAACPK